MPELDSSQIEPAAQKFILHWGEMGYRWGINRTVAQIHALLLLAEHPLRADEIAQSLGIARSNASNSLWELQNWGIVRLVHLSGDRRDHFESMKDIFEMFRVIARERKKREVDPTVQVLRECIAQTGRQKSVGYTRTRFEELLQFFELGTGAFRQLDLLPAPALIKMAKSVNKALRLLGIRKKRALEEASSHSCRRQRLPRQIARDAPRPHGLRRCRPKP